MNKLDVITGIKVLEHISKQAKFFLQAFYEHFEGVLYEIFIFVDVFLKKPLQTMQFFYHVCIRYDIALFFVMITACFAYEGIRYSAIHADAQFLAFMFAV